MAAVRRWLCRHGWHSLFSDHLRDWWVCPCGRIVRGGVGPMSEDPTRAGRDGVMRAYGLTEAGLKKWLDEQDAPKVAFEPCPLFRIPLEGDLLTCRDCGWWIAEHDRAEVAE